MKKKKKEEKTKITKFCFINQGKTITILVTTPVDVPQYKLKEIIDKNFINKGNSIIFDPMLFSQYEGTYEILN